jgi:competence protein ComEA
MRNARILIVLFVALTMVTGLCVTVYAGEAVKVDINKASKEELMQLEGVGDTYAQKIIEFREANGPFQRPDDLLNVKGIGPTTLEKNKNRITIVQVEQKTKKN